VLAEKKTQVDAVTAEYNTINNKHTAMQMVLASTKDPQTLLTSLAGMSAQSASSGGYMGQITDARTQLAQAATEEEQVCVRLKMSRCELGKLKKRWKAVE
jgi:structural maintenance of chromosome 2